MYMGQKERTLCAAVIYKLTISRPLNEEESAYLNLIAEETGNENLKGAEFVPVLKAHLAQATS